MRFLSGIGVTVVGAMLSCGALAQETEMELLRAEVEQLRAHYDARIAELERRLAVAEQNANEARYAVQEDTAAPQAVPSRMAGVAAYNPAIGVIFQGQVWQYQDDPEGYAIQGMPFGGEAGPFADGLSLGETELIFNANVDDKFSAWLTAALALEDGEAVAEVEEAFVETTALPAGLGAKFGRFFSGIGYLNGKHAHAWDFADQPLPYQAFLADQYADNGLQIRWLAPTALFLEVGAEVFEGSGYPAGGSANSGFGSYSLFANVGGDVGTNSSWLGGVSYLDADALERASGDEGEPLLFSGDSTLTSAHFVWKWRPMATGNSGILCSSPNFSGVTRTVPTWCRAPRRWRMTPIRKAGMRRPSINRCRAGGSGRVLTGCQVIRQVPCLTVHRWRFAVMTHGATA